MTLDQQRALLHHLRLRAQHWYMRAELDGGLADALESNLHLLVNGEPGVPEVEKLAEALWAAAAEARTDVPA